VIDGPRVTYSNVELDLGPVHAEFDRRLPGFERQLGGQWGAIVGSDRNILEGPERRCASPIDRRLLLCSYRSATPAVIDRAVRAASRAASEWAHTSVGVRVALLRSFAKAIADRRFELALASLLEVGKSRVEAIGEAEEGVDLPEYYASEMERNGGYHRELRMVRSSETTESLLLPFGVFAVIAPFNFPVALAVNMISGALVTGNTVVFKPSVGCVLTGRMVVEAALDAGIPPGVINLVLGDSDVGHALASHPSVAGLAFTGSHGVGMSLARAALSGVFAKPVIAEMGGKNPAYVTAQADLDVAAAGTARSAFGLQGQKCSACSVAYVEDAVHDQFIEKLCAFTSKLRLGDPRDKGTFLGAVQTQHTIERFKAAVHQASSVGKVVLGGRQATDGALARGFFLEPTIVELNGPGELSREELFMPFLVVRRVPSLSAAIQEGNAVRYGLSAGVYTRDEEELKYFLDHAQAGVLYANRASGATTGAWPGVQSFCGWKGSGVTHKGGLGPHFLPLFTREQSRTLIR
jgi:acyl-CoA reductase-like NAD-dependent aldehyde dehydrogenase